MAGHSLAVIRPRGEQEGKRTAKAQRRQGIDIHCGGTKFAEKTFDVLLPRCVGTVNCAPEARDKLAPWSPCLRGFSVTFAPLRLGALAVHFFFRASREQTMVMLA